MEASMVSDAQEVPVRESGGIGGSSAKGKEKLVVQDSESSASASVLDAKDDAHPGNDAAGSSANAAADGGVDAPAAGEVPANDVRPDSESADGKTALDEGLEKVVEEAEPAKHVNIPLHKRSRYAYLF
jgi:hypothetical protein